MWLCVPLPLLLLLSLWRAAAAVAAWLVEVMVVGAGGHGGGHGGGGHGGGGHGGGGGTSGGGGTIGGRQGRGLDDSAVAATMGARSDDGALHTRCW